MCLAVEEQSLRLGFLGEAVPDSTNKLGYVFARESSGDEWYLACFTMRPGGWQLNASAVCSSMGQNEPTAWSLPASWLDNSPRGEATYLQVDPGCYSGENDVGEERCQPPQRMANCSGSTRPALLSCGRPRPPTHGVAPLCRNAGEAGGWCSHYNPLDVATVTGLGEVHVDVQWPQPLPNTSIPAGTRLAPVAGVLWIAITPKARPDGNWPPASEAGAYPLPWPAHANGTVEDVTGGTGAASLLLRIEIKAPVRVSGAILSDVLRQGKIDVWRSR